jgi:hypothetical protein
MSRQLQVAKDLLILGDSNVERNLLHTGRLYCLQSESVPARNLVEFSEALSQLQLGKYKIIVFAMFTNIVINAGNFVSTNNHAARLTAIEACLKKLIKTITLVICDLL